MERLIRVREFAQSCGCTPQNIYGHLRTYATDLEGHTFRGKGRQGVLLDNYAQDFLRSVMYPKEISDSSLMDEINQLREQLLKIGLKNTELATRLAEAEGERDRAMLEAGEHQRALLAAQDAEAAQKAELQKARQEASEEALRAQEAVQEAQELRSRLEASEAREKALEAKKKEFEDLPFWKKPFWRG